MLETVRPLFDHSGPFATLHLDVSRTTEDARQQLDARWTTARHELERHDLGAGLIDQIEEHLRAERHLTGEARCTIVATRDEVVFTDTRGGHSTWPEAVSVGPLPDLAGWLSSAAGEHAFVLVLADHVGADIEVHLASGRGAAEQVSVDGEAFDIRKLPEGDWMQKKYQQRAENNWRENAELVAGQLSSLARKYRPHLIVVAGEVRARNDLAGVLADTDLAGAPVETIEEGGRADGASTVALWSAVRRLLAELEARDNDAVLHDLERGTAVGRGVIVGADRVADGFVEGKVERLVLDLAEAHETTISAADHPGLVLPSAAQEAGPLPADQVLVAAAALTNADVALLPHGMPLPQEFALAQGIAATLRWDERAPRPQ